MKRRTQPAPPPPPAPPAPAKPKNGNEWVREIIAIEQTQGVREALIVAKKAWQSLPHSIALTNQVGLLRMRNGCYQAAVEAFRQIPNYDQIADVLGNIGLAYRKANDYAEAEKVLTQVLQLAPHHAVALQTLGVIQVHLDKQETAIGYFKRLHAVRPRDSDNLFNIGVAYAKLQQLQEASEWYQRALAVDPKHKGALCNWSMLQTYRSPYDAERIARETIANAGAFAAAQPVAMAPLKAKNPAKKLHIGLVSGDMRQSHPVGYFLAGLFSSQAARQFDWSAYITGKIQQDGLRTLAEPLFRNWRAIDGWADGKVRNQIRADGVDILIDLSGYTGQNRITLFLAQIVPVQLEWLGWFATTGLPHMNGIIADPYCVPPEEEHLYSEKVWRLPHSRLNMKAPSEPVEVAPLAALANGYITFGCYQNPLKISDEVLEVWAQIATQLPDAHWHFKGSVNAPGTLSQIHFQQKLEALGFNPKRLHFSGRSARRDYFAAHNALDLILDTFPFPGGTTTVDALWMGVPTLTLSQAGMVARQGEQLLSAAGYPEFVCRSKAEYVQKALYWSDPANRNALAQIKANMRAQVLRSPLFDTERFGRDWCELMRTIWQQACDN